MPKRQHWYVARSNELMVDLDHKIPDQPPTLLTSARGRLNGSILAGKLDVQDVWLYPSDHPKHYHMVIRLVRDMPTDQRLTWEFYFRNDAFRTLNNFMRLQLSGISNPSLLITSQPYKGFYRLPDDICHCPLKHSQEVMATCPAAERIRGAARVADYFGKPVPMDKPITFGRMEL